MAVTINSTGVRAHTGRMNDPDPEVPERARRRQYSAKYKLEILAAYEALDREGKGALLRREGLYTSLLSEWRKQRDRGALEALATKPGRPPVDPVERENARLRQRVERLEGEGQGAGDAHNAKRHRPVRQTVPVEEDLGVGVRQPKPPRPRVLGVCDDLEHPGHGLLLEPLAWVALGHPASLS